MSHRLRYDETRFESEVRDKVPCGIRCLLRPPGKGAFATDCLLFCGANLTLEPRSRTLSRFLFHQEGIGIRVNYYSGQPIVAHDIIRTIKSCSIENQSTTIYWQDYYLEGSSRKPPSPGRIPSSGLEKIALMRNRPLAGSTTGEMKTIVPVNFRFPTPLSEM